MRYFSGAMLGRAIDADQNEMRLKESGEHLQSIGHQWLTGRHGRSSRRAILENSPLIERPEP
jgi:hypothetical protein